MKIQAGLGQRDCSTIDRVKALVSIADLWRALGLDGDPGRKCHSPFRNDRNPSFSVFDDFRKFKDHATGDGGDVIDFFVLATGFSGNLNQAAEEVAKVVGGSIDMRQSVRREKKAKPIRVDFTKPEDGRYPPGNAVAKFLSARNYSERTCRTVCEEGSIGEHNGHVEFRYPGNNVKARFDNGDSHSCRWMRGGAESAIWRGHLLTHLAIKRVVLMEGETDCMRMMDCAPDDPELAVVAAPNASFRPNALVAGIISQGRRVAICFDGDRAGIDGSFAIRRALLASPGCEGAEVFLPSLNRQDFSDIDQKKRSFFLDRMCNWLYN